MDCGVTRGTEHDTEAITETKTERRAGSSESQSFGIRKNINILVIGQIRRKN